MNVKQIFLTLIVLFVIDSVAMSQVKKQYRDDVDKSTTVVIKEDGANDLDILNNQFNLDDFKVNEQIKITTGHTVTPVSNLSDNVSGGQTALLPTPDLSNAAVSTAPSYERPKTQMKRWSIREKKETTTSEDILPKDTEEKTIAEIPTRTKNIDNAKKSSSGKYRKKSKKVKKKKRVRKLKNRKRKTRRNKKGSCYKF